MTKAFDLITKAKTIAIVGHIRPDGDCIGSALALNGMLEQMKKQVSIFFDGDIASQFDYLDGFDKIQNDPSRVDEKAVFDLLIIVDLNSTDRLGRFEFLKERAKHTICFDHHIGFNIKDVDAVINGEDYTSCGELIYNFFVANKIKITKQIADALYTSISTDTGCFLYPNTTLESHIITAELIKLGCDVQKINYINFRVYDPVLIKGLKQLLRNLRVLFDGQLSISLLKDGRAFGATERHKLKQYLSDIKGIKVSVLIAGEGKGLFHVALRSHGDIDVEVIARHFGGGGHKNAAGFAIKGKYKHVVKKIIAEARKHIT